MDAIEFVKQLRRMNEQGVPKNRFIYPCVGQETDSPEEVVAEVEEWAKEHPIKTRQSEYLKLFPGADIDEDDGCLVLNPCNVYEKMRKECGGRKCSECRKEFWFTEVEEGKDENGCS